MRVSKEFRFEAAHSLPHLPETHKCHRLHGHSYRFVVWVEGELDLDNEWVMDYADISKIVERNVISQLDHQNLNDILHTYTTAERLVVFIWAMLADQIPGLCCIELYETPTSCVKYYGPSSARQELELIRERISSFKDDMYEVQSSVLRDRVQSLASIVDDALKALDRITS